MNNFIEFFYNMKIDKIIYNDKYYSFLYNNYFYKKPFNIMYKVFRYNEKQKFISKKIESYEILKD